MRILIQNVETAAYLSKGRKWTNSAHEAFAFLNEVRARDYCIYQRIAGVAVVVLRASDAVESTTPWNSNLCITETANENDNRNMKPKEAGSIQQSKPKAAAGNGVSSLQRRAQKPTGPRKTEATAKATLPGNPNAADNGVAEPHSRRNGVIVVEAKVDVGFGNKLFIRGRGAGLSWDKGAPLQCIAPSTWVWFSSQAGDQVLFKLLLNDAIWSEGEDLVAGAGKPVQVVPSFQ